MLGVIVIPISVPVSLCAAFRKADPASDRAFFLRRADELARSTRIFLDTIEQLSEKGASRSTANGHDVHKCEKKIF